MTAVDQAAFDRAYERTRERLLTAQQRLQQMQQVAQSNCGRHEELLRHQHHGRHLLATVGRIVDHGAVLLNRFAQALNDHWQPVSNNHGLAPSRSGEGSVGRSSAVGGVTAADDSRPGGPA